MTNDDHSRMDLANTIGADMVLDLQTALAIADRILASDWLADRISDETSSLWWGRGSDA